MEGPSSPRDQRPQALGSRYELRERLGIGAMGEVWRALDRQTGRYLAAKVLRAEYARDTDIVTRFIQERSILLSLTHPNIVRVRDLVVEGERLAIVMDLVEGGDLRRHLREKGPVASEHAVPLVCVVLDALASAHEAGCLHRDVKPDNVLLLAGDVSRPQDARLSDFSIARLAHESTVQSTGLLGTPGYMPPELFRDGQFSGASDVYATGVLLYELLGGRTPFAGAGTAHTIGNRHVSSAPPPLPVPAPLWEVIEQMLAKEPRARLGAQATAAALRALPASALRSEPLPPQPVPDSWENVDHTVVRGAPGAGRHSSSGPAASVGAAAGTPTLARPGRRVAGRPVVPAGQPGQPGQPDRPGRRRLAWVAGATVLVLLAVGLGYAATRGSGPAAADPSPERESVGGVPFVSAQLTDPPLPIGLTIAREAEYDVAADRLELTITYSAGSAPVGGPFLEVFPASSDGAECPLAAWEGGEQQRSTTSATGVRADCPAYVVEVPPIAAQGREQVSVVLSGVGLDLGEDAAALDGWLQDASAATADALAGPSVGDEQFPVQRLTGIWLEASPFSVSVLDEVRVEIGPRFVTGERGPAFFDSTDTTGVPSVFLQQIAGGFEGVRLSGCPAVRINAQRRVSPLRQFTDCAIEGEVGKVLVAEDSITITGAGS